jgi:poly(glycerol-phosphate) alpha-glucosyltransferase
MNLDLEVLSLRDGFTNADAASWKPVPIQVFDPKGPSSFGYAAAMNPALGREDYDLAHTHGLWTYPSHVVTRWHCSTGRPYLVSPHGMLDSWALENSRVKKRVAAAVFENRHLHHAACLHALCESEAQSMRRYGLNNPIAVIPNGIDRPSDDPVGTTRRETPWREFVRPEQKVLLFLSRLHPKKGLVPLLQGWASARASFASDAGPGRSRLADWLLVIAGWEQGGHEQQLKLLATDLGISWCDVRDSRCSASAIPSLVFVGPQFDDQKAVCYANCDAFVLPSHSEGLPMVVLEAWAYAKPVLMTPECHLPEGFAVDAAIKVTTDPTQIANRLVELFQLADTRLSEIGRNGRELVEAKYTWPTVAGQMASVYRWLVGAASKPECVFDE